MTILFVSDLHLHSSRPAVTDCFLRFLADTASQAKALYILGDLFESWIGDDAPGTTGEQVCTALRSFTARGVPCSFMHGNRDFLIGQDFAARSGLTLLPDETIIDLYGERALLMHGDTLCSDDHAYQRYRRIVRSPVVQALYLALPVRARSHIEAQLRSRSTASHGSKPAMLMDVNQQTVAAVMERHGVSLLIHGHTHRPAIHRFDNAQQATATRIVLGDWYEQGSVLRWTPSGPELQHFGLH
ncbi:MAG: UDP-2,3-diacylglucosamine diphosphatase [Gammaproteobacteria bacterium]|jgi:UDP-2,3-diacylglucosamine hydrolase|nr:UDP-2,3-diacylglucosamine diphosphatase [Gammaproteobacteria bacterium]